MTRCSACGRLGPVRPSKAGRPKLCADCYAKQTRCECGHAESFHLADGNGFCVSTGCACDHYHRRPRP